VQPFIEGLEERAVPGKIVTALAVNHWAHPLVVEHAPPAAVRAHAAPALLANFGSFGGLGFSSVHGLGSLGGFG
jgi:hypothetical protein